MQDTRRTDQPEELGFVSEPDRAEVHVAALREPGIRGSVGP
jgi:hypothetical protein